MLRTMSRSVMNRLAVQLERSADAVGIHGEFAISSKISRPKPESNYLSCIEMTGMRSGVEISSRHDGWSGEIWVN